MDFELLFLGYWPKLVIAVWFSILNIIMAYRYLGKKQYILERFVVLFLLSSSFLSIIGEQLIIRVYNNLVDSHVFVDDNNLIFIAMNIIADATIIFIGGNLFTKFTGLNNFVGATVYMEFVCIERMCLVVAVSYLGFITFYFLLQLLFTLLFFKDQEYLFKTKNLNWKSIFVYLIGLFYILDLLYSAYFIFPELGTNIINPQNLFWLDTFAVITFGFVIGYIKLSITEAREHDQKIKYYKHLQENQENIIITLAEISEAKSGETGQHVRRVAEYSKLLAVNIGLSEYECEKIKIAAMMHDLGKLMIDSNIIEKQDKLTVEEYEIVKKHSQLGHDILSKSKGEIMDMAKVIALQHHERWDGGGYPRHLIGEEISIYAQIVSVVDVFDALTSERSYKKAWSLEDAKTEIEMQRGQQFSPQVVDVFVQCFDQIEAIHKAYRDN